MHIVSRNLLDTCLIMLSKVPGRKALLLVPLALGYSKVDKSLYTTKADSLASFPGSTASSTALAVLPGGTSTAAAAGGVPGLLGNLLGQNEFATVRSMACWSHAYCYPSYSCSVSLASTASNQHAHKAGLACNAWLQAELKACSPNTMHVQRL